MNRVRQTNQHYQKHNISPIVESSVTTPVNCLVYIRDGIFSDVDGWYKFAKYRTTADLSDLPYNAWRDDIPTHWSNDARERKIGRKNRHNKCHLFYPHISPDLISFQSNISRQFHLILITQLKYVLLKFSAREKKPAKRIILTRFSQGDNLLPGNINL